MASCELPEELVIEEILTRLPVKSLMRFKCVCTFWCSLVESPSFISKHFDRNNKNRIHDDDGSCSILVKHRRDVKDHFMLLSYETLDVISEDLGFQSFRSGDIPALVQEEILGCCNGVICMYNIHYKDIVLWNPATRQAKLVHESTIPHPKDSEPSCLEIGFGYDVVTNDYKVIRIAGFHFPHLHLPGVLRTEVYSLSTDSWRLIDAVVPDPVSCMGSPYHRTCVNGIYSVWGSFPQDDGTGAVVRNEVLISFDMSKEIFLLTPVPEFFDTEGNTCYKFFRALNESVALIMDKSEGVKLNHFDVWVLSEYGPDGSWSKLYTIGPFLSDYLFPVGFWKNDALFFETRDGEMVLCDRNTREFKSLQVEGEKGQLQLFAYKESLVFFKGENHLPLKKDFLTSLTRF